MTREEAIKQLTSLRIHSQGRRLDRDIEALDMAIKVLEQEPCEDCISRESAIKQCGFGMTNLLIADCIRRLPSVTPSYNSIKTELKPS